jgi:nicotinate-nucleotide adenylyltransferase
VRKAPGAGPPASENTRMNEQAARRIGILGGTFNPIHVGHLILAQSAIEHFDLSSVLFIPCTAPPHKPSTHLVEGAHRLAMIEHAIEGNPAFEVSKKELQRTGVSYAVDTVAHLARSQPNVTLFFIIGADMLAILHKWRSIYDLLALCRFVSFGRPGGAAELTPEQIKLDAPWPERLLKDYRVGRQIDISSSEIRYRIAEGLSIRYLVTPEVEMYIAEHGLYRR